MCSQKLKINLKKYVAVFDFRVSSSIFDITCICRKKFFVPQLDICDQSVAAMCCRDGRKLESIFWSNRKMHGFFMGWSIYRKRHVYFFDGMVKFCRQKIRPHQLKLELLAIMCLFLRGSQLLNAVRYQKYPLKQKVAFQDGRGHIIRQLKKYRNYFSMFAIFFCKNFV